MNRSGCDEAHIIANELVGREAFECPEPAIEVIGRDEAGEVLPEFVVAPALATLERRPLWCGSSSRLSIGRWMLSPWSRGARYRFWRRRIGGRAP